MASDSLEIPSARLAILVVRGVTQLQEPLLDERAEARSLGRL
jgi:hypothetical protein